MSAWEDIGFEKKLVDAFANNVVTDVQEWWNGPPESPDKVDGWVFDTHLDGVILFALGWLNYELCETPANDWREAGRRVVRATVHYFFDAWRDKFVLLSTEYDRAKARAKLEWIDYYREGLALALALSDWESADRLIEWPGPDLPDEDGSWNRTTKDLAFHIWLATTLRGDTTGTAESEREVADRKQRRMSNDELNAGIESGEISSIGLFEWERIVGRASRRRPKMLLAAADALFAEDADAFKKALTKYMKHYKQRELDTGQIYTGICLDGMILWHLARRRGLGEIELPEDLMVFIARP